MAISKSPIRGAIQQKAMEKMVTTHIAQASPVMPTKPVTEAEHLAHMASRHSDLTNEMHMIDARRSDVQKELTELQMHLDKSIESLRMTAHHATPWGNQVNACAPAPFR